MPSIYQSPAKNPWEGISLNRVPVLSPVLQYPADSMVFLVSDRYTIYQKHPLVLHLKDLVSIHKFSHFRLKTVRTQPVFWPGILACDYYMES